MSLLSHSGDWSAIDAGASLKISIITACKDNSATVDSCIASVARQTFGSVEHVVIDCHSKDDSSERIFAQRDRLSIVYCGADETRFQAWNRGIGHASGDVLGFVDATDELADSKVLEKIAQAFDRPWVSAVYGDVLCVHSHDATHVMRYHHSGQFSRGRLSRGWAPPTTALFVRESWYRRIGGFAPGMKFAADYDASLRLFSRQFFKAVYLQQPVVRQRLSSPGVGQLRNVVRTPIEEFKALRASQVGGWGALAWRNLSKVGGWL